MRSPSKRGNTERARALHAERQMPRERIRARWDALRGGAGPHGKIRDVPGMAASLRTLLWDGYSQADIANMFAVTRETVRLWVRRLGIDRPPWGRGTRDRLWDDEARRFVPVLAKGGASRIMARRRSHERNEMRRAGQRERVIALLRTLAVEFGRSPTFAEVASRHHGRPVAGSFFHALCSGFSAEGERSALTRDPTAWARRAYQAAGLDVRGTGGAGHRPTE